MERRDGSRTIGVLKETAIQAAIALGKPELTLSLSRRFGRRVEEQLANWREAHIVAAKDAPEEIYQRHIKAMDNPPPLLQPSSRT